MKYQAPYEIFKKDGDNGWDIRANEDIIIPPGKTRLVGTGIHFKFANGFFADLRPRSGLSSQGILCHLGLVDTDYRGEIKACLTNLNDVDYEIKTGDRIAQLVFCQEVNVYPCRVESINKDTERGTKGFGSSGK